MPDWTIEGQPRFADDADLAAMTGTASRYGIAPVWEPGGAPAGVLPGGAHEDSMPVVWEVPGNKFEHEAPWMSVYGAVAKRARGLSGIPGGLGECACGGACPGCKTGMKGLDGPFDFFDPATGMPTAATVDAGSVRQVETTSSPTLGVPASDPGLSGKDIASIIGASAGLLAASVPGIIAATRKPERQDYQQPPAAPVLMPQFQPLAMQPRAQGPGPSGSGSSSGFWDALPWLGGVLGVGALGYGAYRLATR